MVTQALGTAAFVKLGAEGVYCGALPTLGLGFALKCDDGTPRAAEAATASLLQHLPRGQTTRWSASRIRSLTNWNGMIVGGMCAADCLTVENDQVPVLPQEPHRRTSWNRTTEKYETPIMGRQAMDKTEFPLIARVFTVLAAIFLVGAIALATMLPPDMTLHEAMHAIDAMRADALAAYSGEHVRENDVGLGDRAAAAAAGVDGAAVAGTNLRRRGADGELSRTTEDEA